MLWYREFHSYHEAYVSLERNSWGDNCKNYLTNMEHNVKCKKNNMINLYIVFTVISKLYAYRQNPGIEV